MLDFIKIVTGLAFLYYGGDFLVHSSACLARYLKISPFVIGATVIAFGTSAPELAVGIFAAMDAAPEIAMGNVIGSNIANIGLVLGVACLISTIAIPPNQFKREFPPFLISALLILFLAWDLKIHHLEGVLMVVLLSIYVLRSFKYKEEFSAEPEKEVKLFSNKGPAFQSFLILIGLTGLVGGAKLLVSGGVSIARFFDISEWFIGITIVAIGTSLPEIVSSIIAARRGYGEMVIGTIFGSNIFNFLLVLGITALIHPLDINEPIQPDLLIAIGTTCLLLILVLIGKYSLGKKSGSILLITYFLYIALKSITNT